jgi:putative membrane protein
MIKRFLYRTFCGFFLGISIFAPGFSGSVVAIAMGIYQDLLRIISNPFRRLKENFIFCLPLVIGAVFSAVVFVISFKFLFETYEKATYLLFVGLIAGNLPVIFNEVKKCGFKKHYLIGGVFAAALTYGIIAAEFVQASSIDGIVSGMHIIALGGLACGAAALIPGMSNSTVLIVMGLYSQLIFAAEALLRANFTYLLPLGIFGFCAVAGLVLASRGIKFVFERFPGFANVTVFGFMIGSLIGILSQSLQLHDANFNWLQGALMPIAGLGISIMFVVLGKSMRQ